MVRFSSCILSIMTPHYLVRLKHNWKKKILHNRLNGRKRFWIPECMKFDYMFSIKSQNAALLRKIEKSIFKWWFCFISSNFLHINQTISTLHNKDFHFSQFWAPQKIAQIFRLSAKMFWLKFGRNEIFIILSRYVE